MRVPTKSTPMKNIIISEDIMEKLRAKHCVSVREIEQSFENLYGQLLTDSREEHKTNPPTLWFVAPTNLGRVLKVVFMNKDGKIHIKSAYTPSQAVIDLYEKHAK